MVSSSKAFDSFVEVHLPRLAIDALDFRSGLEVGLLHLQRHQLTRERHDADVVSWRGLHRHHVAFFERQMVVVAEISLACVFKLHLNEVGEPVIAGNIGQIVIGVQLFILPAASLGAKAPQAAV
jgi:hypothetical protein